MPNLDEPITREEQYLAKAAGMDVTTPAPITRKEKYLAAIAENGGGGGTGENGATFTPTVSTEGVISWTNDKELPNPPSVNIKGPAGPAPVKGADYWTVADKADIVDDVLDALPTWTGGSY